MTELSLPILGFIVVFATFLLIVIVLQPWTFPHDPPKGDD